MGAGMPVLNRKAAALEKIAVFLLLVTVVSSGIGTTGI